MPKSDMFDLKWRLLAAREAHADWARQQKRRRCASCCRALGSMPYTSKDARKYPPQDPS